MAKKGQHFSSLGGNSDGLYTLSDDDIKRLHAVLLDMYKEIKEVCSHYNIHLIAAGGTALGAIRHRGFIPWDDDMDLFMFRSDFEALKRVFKKELGDRYYLLAPGTKQGANCFLPRIMKKNTTLLGMIDETAPYPHGIYIDINIIEYAPENKLLFKLKSIGADARRVISYSVYWNQYKSSTFREYMLNSKGANYYKIRMFIGKVFSLRKSESWFKSFDRYVQGKKSNVVTVPSGTKKYSGEKLSIKTVLPLVEVPFEDTNIYVFNNYKGYLKNLYGDYMQIPEKNNRERHLCVRLDFDKE